MDNDLVAALNASPEIAAAYQRLMAAEEARLGAYFAPRAEVSANG